MGRFRASYGFGRRLQNGGRTDRKFRHNTVLRLSVMNTLLLNVSRRLSSAAFQILVASAVAATPWLSTLAIASEPAPAVAQANKSASVSADSTLVELVNYDLFTQNEAATTQPPAAPPAQPLPRNPEAKPAPTGKGPAPPAATTNPESPATPAG